MMWRSAGVAILMSWGPAAGAQEPSEMSWTVRVAGKEVGTRTLQVTPVERGGRSVRLIEMRTEIDGTVMGQSLRYRQRVDGVAGRYPASFHAVIDEAGEPRQLQVQYSDSGWSITRIDRRSTQTVDADATTVAMSTVDLFDPGSRYGLARHTEVGMLSAETGEVWQGSVERSGFETLRVGGRAIEVDGWVWKSPEGRHAFWYDTEGVLVKYETRVMGVKVEGMLSKPPPKGPDVFPVRTARASVEVVDIG